MMMTDEDGLKSEEIDLEALISENSHLKKKLGDQGNEIGELRKATDLLLQTQSQQQEEDDWDFDPVEKEVKNLKNELSSIKTEAALRELEQKKDTGIDG
jgi:predicted RNase H-like nuclease (RuvC/YqgF family)